MGPKPFVVLTLFWTSLWASNKAENGMRHSNPLAYGGSGIVVSTQGDVMDDIYFISVKQILKVARQNADVLKECLVWNITETVHQDIIGRKVSVSETEMNKLIVLCHQSTTTPYQRLVKAIYPGTKWCGIGNDADNHDDIGELEEEDKCCRAHDYCRPCIRAFDTRYGLYNFAIWTKMHCQCDTAYYHCLKAVNSTHATRLGRLFFNILEVGCFAKIRPKKCVDYSEDGSCQLYVADISQPRIWAFVDNEHHF